MEFKDYYRILGVERGAGADEVKKSYRRLARKYHPDVSKEADASARMAEVNEAYAALSDPERRAAYDAVGQGRRDGESFTPPPNWDAGFEFSGTGADGAQAQDFSDFFAELFGRAQAARGGRGASRGSAGNGFKMRGEDQYARILLRVADAFAGGERQITLRHPVFDDSGHVALKTRTLDVKIPAGIRPGQLIRLAGQGSPGAGGAPSGDLLLEVEFEPDERFRVEGANLVATLPLAPWEAALGAVVPVLLPDGSTLKVRAPAGAQPGRVLTVRGKGLPGPEPGDLELTVQVVLPSGMDPRARPLYEQMEAELPDFDARRAWAAEAARAKEKAA